MIYLHKRKKMIVNFSVENFSSIKTKQNLSFEAGKNTHLEKYYVTKVKTQKKSPEKILKIALIYGANASGKTNILRALDFLRNLVLNPLEKKTDELNFNPFLFDKHTPNKNTQFCIEFIQNEIKYHYEVELNRQAIVKENLIYYNPNRSMIFSRTTDIDGQFTEIHFGSKIKVIKAFEKVLEANTLWNNTVLGGYLKTNIEIKELRAVTDWFKNYLYGMISPNDKLREFVFDLYEKGIIKKQNILQIIKQADFNISNVLIGKKKLINYINERNNYTYNNVNELIEYIIDDNNELFIKDLKFIHKINNNDYELPFELESQGTQRFFGLAGLLSLLLTKKVSIPIDELEASLHPDLFEYFLLSFLINAKYSQVIATTHNREILNSRDIIRDDTIWITNKNKESATELYSLADFDTSVLRKDTNRLNAYKSGKLGGVPNLGDYYLNLE